MKIATTIGEMYKYDPVPANTVRLYKGTGFRYLDYSFYRAYVKGSAYLEESDLNWKKEVEDAGNAAAECGFKFVQAHAPGYNPMGIAEDHDACLRTMSRSVEACGMLGIPTTVVHTSFSPYHIYPMGKDAYFKYNKEFLRGMLETAEKYGVFVCIENSSVKNMRDQYYPRTPEEMNELVAYIDHPLVKCCWDTGHAVMEGKGDQYEDFVKLGSNLKAVHIHDNGTLSDQHLAPYTGALQMDSVIKGLLDCKYDGYFTYEADAFMNKVNGTGPLSRLPLELRQEALALLYKTAKFMLETYNAFEE